MQMVKGFYDFLLEDSYEKLPLHMGSYDWGVSVPLDHIQPWEPDSNKSRYTINYLKERYLKYKNSNDINDLPQPIILEPNTGKIKLRSSGNIIHTGSRNFVIYDGHHRLIAAKEAGLNTINAQIRHTQTVGQI